jgi:DNA-directed RNA polymerase subunit beta
MPYPVTIGKRTRMSFSKIKEIADLPNLIEIQVDSYKWFLEEGLKEVFEDISPIEDYTGNLILEFVDYSLDEKPKYDIEECKERDATYHAPLNVKVRLINKETGEIKEQKVFMGDFPLMTDRGTFVINGAERVIVSQLVRSPGVYYALDRDMKTGKKMISSTVIPNRGAWLEYETDTNDVIYVRVDRTRKQPVTVLLRALGIGTDEEIKELLGEDERLLATLDKDNTNSVESGLVEIYKKLRPGEPPTVESASSLINALFFDAKRYDLAKVGRYKFNKKLALAYRIMNRISCEDIINPETGEVFVKDGEKISYEKAWEIQNSGINVVHVLSEDEKKVMKAIRQFLPKATSPKSVAGPSAITSPASITSFLFMIGVWFTHVPEFDLLNLSSLYLSLFPSSLLITISSAVTLSAIPECLATTTAPESLAALYSQPVPIIGASLLTRGTA